MDWLLAVVFILIAFMFGVEITERRFAKQYSDKIGGCLKIDTNDPDGPYVFAEFNRPIEEIFSNKYVVMKIDIDPFTRD